MNARNFTTSKQLPDPQTQEETSPKPTTGVTTEDNEKGAETEVVTWDTKNLPDAKKEGLCYSCLMTWIIVIDPIEERERIGKTQ